MSIDGIVFLCSFLPAVLVLHWLIPGARGKNALLLLGSLLFCAFSGLGGLALLLGAALANFLLGLLLRGEKARRLLCVLGIAANLVFLASFKYLNFLLNGILGLPALELGLAAPLGISFFCFKGISYLVDVYRDKTLTTGNFFRFLLYFSFFPQIMAGPIARYPQFETQLEGRRYDPEAIARGLRRFIVGLGKKLIVAGILAKAADGVFALEPAALDIRLAWLGAMAYLLQIYYDFSGYSDMAIGLGNAFGIATPENFDYPYIASSITEFWRRWHLSLSGWFKDYLYIPLGGNRKGKTRAAVNKAIVFTLCGIWHGAAWTFLVWGAWHGLLSALESLKIVRFKGQILSRLYTLLAVCLGFVIFRAATLEQGFGVIGAMFTGFSVTQAGTVLLTRLLTGETVLALLVGGLFALPVVPWIKKQAWYETWLEPLSYGACLVLFCLCLLRMASGGFAPFIYAQF